MFREVLRQNSVLAVARSTRKQVAAPKIRRNDVQTTPSRSRRSRPARKAAAASTATADFPRGYRVSLQCFFRGSGSRRVEMKQTRLCAGIHFDLESVIVEP